MYDYMESWERVKSIYERVQERNWPDKASDILHCRSKLR